MQVALEAVLVSGQKDGLLQSIFRLKTPLLEGYGSFLSFTDWWLKAGLAPTNAGFHNKAVLPKFCPQALQCGGHLGL